MGDITENIRNERRVPDRPTHGDLKAWAKQTLVEGQNPDPGKRTHTDCPECGYSLVTGRESHGPDLDGFEEVLSTVADRYEGQFTEEEFRDLCREAFEEALDDAVDDEETDLDGAAHRTLDSFDRDEARLAFDSALVDALLDGRKTATVRYDLEPGRLEPGTRVHIVTSGDDRTGPVAVASVADIIRTDLSDALDAVDDRGYRHTADRVLDLWRDLLEYYDTYVGLSTEVEVVLLDDIRAVSPPEVNARDDERDAGNRTSPDSMDKSSSQEDS